MGGIVEENTSSTNKCKHRSSKPRPQPASTHIHAPLKINRTGSHKYIFQSNAFHSAIESGIPSFFSIIFIMPAVNTLMRPPNADEYALPSPYTMQCRNRLNRTINPTHASQCQSLVQRISA